MIRTSLLLLLTGSAAFAETVTIRSGQHESFSRLVLSTPAGREWNLVRSGEGYDLTLGGSDDEFDVSAIFERITNNRIANVTQIDQRLRIDLACDCHADAFLWQPDRLVVDIIDGPAPPESEFEATLMVAETLTQPPAQIRLPILTEEPQVETPVPFFDEPFSSDLGSDSEIAEAERAIVESLARAASQGVFDIPETPLPFVADDLTEDGEQNLSQSPPILPSVTDPMEGVSVLLEVDDSGSRPGLTLRTGMASDLSENMDAGSNDDHCINDELVSLHEWGGDRDYASQISERRRALTTEFDNYPENAIEALARTELFFGFGREAQVTLAIDGQRSRERTILNGLAQLIDGEPVESGIFDDQLDCEGFVVLWAALAAEDIGQVSQKGRDAAVMAFRLLPDALRGHIGAELAELFRRSGDPVLADMVLASSKQQGDALDIQADLTAAELVGVQEGPSATIDALNSIAENDARLSAAGLARLIELQIEQGKSPDRSLLELAQAMRFEARGSADVGRLALAEIAGHASSDDFATALAMVSDETISLTDDERSAAASALTIAIAERQTDQAFLDYIFNDQLIDISSEAENALAQRLLSLGFPERALDLLSGSATQEAMAERRYLRAQAAASLNDLAGVETALAGLSDERANGIRASVLAATGDFEQSLAQRLAAGSEPAEADDAWRAGAWALLEAGDDALLQDASQAILTPSAPLAAVATLEERRLLLEQAQDTRNLTEELLGRFSIEPEE